MADPQVALQPPQLPESLWKVPRDQSSGDLAWEMFAKGTWSNRPRCTADACLGGRGHQDTGDPWSNLRKFSWGPERSHCAKVSDLLPERGGVEKEGRIIF